MLRDVRLGLRTLMHAKGWTAVIVISLALGIGANTALFSVVNSLLLKKLPVKEPDSLVRLRYAGRNDMRTSSSDYGSSGRDAMGRDIRSTFSYPMFQTFVAENRTMEELFACAPIGRVNVVVKGEGGFASAFVSTGNYYRMLGVSAQLGRTIVPEDDRPTAAPVAVISHRYWRSRFGSDPQVIGRVVHVNTVPVTIVGVLPPEFTGVQRAVAAPSDIALPLLAEPPIDPDEQRLGATRWWLQVMGRVKPGVAVEQLQANLANVFRHTARSGFDAFLASLPASERATSGYQQRTNVPDLVVDSGARGVYEPREAEVRSAAILGGVVVLVLLLVCANVANLLLSRAAARQKEISVRLSLGATRLRLVRQLLTESLILAGIGGALGIAVGYWGKRLLPGPAGEPVPLDLSILAFATLVTAATGIAFGIAPAMRATGANVSAALKDNSRSIAGSRSLLGKSLLVVQVAISIVLLIGAGLFLRTLDNLRSVDVGFNPENLVLFPISPERNRYDEARSRALYEDVLTRLRALPGVRAAALSHMAMLSGGVNSTSIYVQGRTYEPGARIDNEIYRLVIAPAFFDVMEIPLVAGRKFSERDHTEAPKVAIVNQAAARKYFPNENPVGLRFGMSIEKAGELEVVGILSDVKYDAVREPAPPTMYVPYTQTRVTTAVFELRTAADPLSLVPAIREVVRQVDPSLPLGEVSTQVEHIERRFQQEKVFAQAYSLFGALALVVAAIGLFGLMSYNVSRRTNEIGVRMALGAQRGHVLRLVMRESMVLVLVGTILGIALAIAGGRLVATLLFGLSPTDAATMTLAAAVMAVVSGIAGYLPARRASRVDPLVALRYE